MYIDTNEWYSAVRGIWGIWLKFSRFALEHFVLLRHDNRRRLRETVPLDDRNTDITKELLHLELQLGTTRKGTFEFTTKIVLDFVQYEIFSEVPVFVFDFRVIF